MDEKRKKKLLKCSEPTLYFETKLKTKILTISWVVDDLGEAVRSVSFHIKRLDLHLKLSDLEVFIGGNEVGVPVNVPPRLGVGDGLVPPVVSVMRLERHDVAKLFAVEIPRLHGLRGQEWREKEKISLRLC